MNDNRAKKYNSIKLWVGVGKGVLTAILLFAFVALGYSTNLENQLRDYFDNDYLIFLLFTITAGLFSTVLFFPVNYFTEYYLEHKYGLSNQTFLKWIWENTKGALVGGAIGVPLLLIFYFVISTFGNLWWLVFATVLFVFSVVLAQILPIVILPIFYKITPLDDEDLSNRITRLAGKVKMKVENVFKFDMSKNTKKANAAFTGLGKTKRIILGDTLIENFSNDEVETVIAHEIGHYKHKHITKNILIGTISSFLTFFLIAELYNISYSWFGFENITVIAAFPLLALWSMLIGVIQTPFSNWILRKFEYQADEYAVKETAMPDVFVAALEKLTEQNLGDADPHPFVEWFFYSHPSIKNRKAFVRSLSKNDLK